MICAIGAGIVCTVAKLSADRRNKGFLAGLCMTIAVTFGMATFAFAIIGAIRFVKWVWGG